MLFGTTPDIYPCDASSIPSVRSRHVLRYIYPQQSVGVKVESSRVGETAGRAEREKTRGRLG